MVKTFEYREPEALKWAINNQAGNCLALNSKNFEKVAEGMGLDFVTIQQVPAVSIARDLTEAARAIAAEMAAEEAAIETGRLLLCTIEGSNPAERATSLAEV
jgi:hypothetical protein